MIQHNYLVLKLYLIKNSLKAKAATLLCLLSFSLVSASGFDGSTLVTSSSAAFKNFVLISAPGSGKGTFSQYLVEKYGYIQICPGDIFRSEVNAQTELGKKIQPILDKGEYVDESITCALISEGITKALSQNKPFIVDGFPRTTYSFQFLLKFLKSQSLTQDVLFLQLRANDEECINRIASRCICVTCCKVYNINSIKPKDLSACDNCGTTLSLRTADTVKIAQKRLRDFHEDIEPLMQLAQGFYQTEYIDTICPLNDLKACYDKLI